MSVHYRRDNIIYKKLVAYHIFLHASAALSYPLYFNINVGLLA